MSSSHELLRSRVQEIHPSSILVTRAAMLDGIGIVDEAMPGSYGEDYEWLLRAAGRAPSESCRRRSSGCTGTHRRSSRTGGRSSSSRSTYLLDRHPEFQQEPKGLARLYGRLAFAHAALGQRSDARRWAGKSLRLNPRERRAYLALGVSLRLVSAERLMRMAHRKGKGL